MAVLARKQADSLAAAFGSPSRFAYHESRPEAILFSIPAFHRDGLRPRKSDVTARFLHRRNRVSWG
jgi:hypothetical protein